MSLKTFHLFFITLALILMLGLGSWCLKFYLIDHQLMNLWLGVSSLGIGVVLIVCEAVMFRKLKALH